MLESIRLAALEVKQNAEIRLCIQIVGLCCHRSRKLRNRLCRLIGLEKLIRPPDMFLRRDDSLLREAVYLSRNNQRKSNSKGHSF